MDWIKKNYDRCALAVCAFALVAVGALLVIKTQGFSEKFADALLTPSKSNKLPDVNTGVIGDAKKRFDEPITWSATNHSGLLFTSEQYLVEDGKLKRPTGLKYPHSRTGEEIPGLWFTQYSLPVLDGTVQFQDPDGDGFLNEDEWLHKTDPTKKESHPPYYTQLFLKMWVKVPFRLKFQTYDGAPTDMARMTFQINTVDLRQPTEFLKIGDTVNNTKFKIIKFELKEKDNPSTGVKDDVSELTLENTETTDKVVLILNQVVDSPNQFGDFEYRWNKKHGEPGQIIRVAKLKEFVLQPQIDQKFKLLDVTEAQAVIQRPNGEKYTVPPLNLKK